MQNTYFIFDDRGKPGIYIPFDLDSNKPARKKFQDLGDLANFLVEKFLNSENKPNIANGLRVNGNNYSVKRMNAKRLNDLGKKIRVALESGYLARTLVVSEPMK